MSKFTPPTLTHKWVKVLGSDTKTIYPHEFRVNHKDGIHWHFEVDKTMPEVVKCTPTILEDEGDGQYTFWQYTVWGPIGRTSRLAKGVAVVPLKTRADFAEAERLEKLLSKNGWAADMVLTAHGIKT